MAGMPTTHLPGQAIAAALNALPWTQAGQVLGLYQRVAKEPGPRRVAQLQALAHHGLAGARHAAPHSPRQLLLADAASYRDFQLPEAALRENILVDFSTAALASGSLLRLGAEVVLWTTFHCEPCSLLERRCPGTLKAIGQHRGMLARVVQGGLVRQGDAIGVVPSAMPAISNEWQARVVWVVLSIPAGQHLSYRMLAEMAGVASVYCRAFPKLLAQLPADIASRVHSTASAPPGPMWDGAELFDTRRLTGAAVPSTSAS
jgi:MOSC domain-containing protein YiiM